MDEITRTIWVLSRPVCLSVIENLRQLLHIDYQTSFQHVKLSDSELKRDKIDMKKMEEFIDETNIFDGELRNISNGLIADDKVNVQDFLMIG